MPNVRYSIGRAPLYIDVNIVGSINLLGVTKAYSVGNCVFASTSSAYGHTKQLPFMVTDRIQRGETITLFKRGTD